MQALPPWLTVRATASLVLAALCAFVIWVDFFRGHRQKLWIMNVVWPIAAPWSGPLGLRAYFDVGRLSTENQVQRAKALGRDRPQSKAVLAKRR
jgi:hypothetical protein